jgi:hypothetical protein
VLPLGCYKPFLVFVLVLCVVVRVLIPAKYDSLADKIKCVRTATETTIGGFKAVYTSEGGDSSVVSSGVVKDKIPQPIWGDLVGG